jgi:hypothetical protein
MLNKGEKLNLPKFNIEDYEIKQTIGTGMSKYKRALFKSKISEIKNIK